MTHRACQFLEDRARARKGERPWCLVVGLILPHNPLICDRRWFDYYIERLPAPPPVDPEYLASLHPGIRAWRQRRGVEQITAAQRQRARAAYYGLVSEMDERVGQVLSTLDVVRVGSGNQRNLRQRPRRHGRRAAGHVVEKLLL